VMFFKHSKKNAFQRKYALIVCKIFVLIFSEKRDREHEYRVEKKQ